MRLSPATTNTLLLALKHAYDHEGLRSIRSLAAHVQRSRPLVYRLVREHSSAFPELAYVQKLRVKRRRRPQLLDERQLSLLFNSSPSLDLLDIRRTARELFDIELLDTTAYKYIAMYKEGTLLERPPERRGRQRMVTEEQMRELVAFFDKPHARITTNAVREKLIEMTGRPVARSTAYYYQKEIEHGCRQG